MTSRIDHEPWRPGRILVVDDEPVYLRSLTRRLRNVGCPIDTASDAASAIAEIEKHRPDLALIDYLMPEMNGLDLLVRIKARWPEIRVVLISAVDNEEVWFKAGSLGADGVAAKSTSHEEMIARAARAAPTSEPRTSILVRSRDGVGVTADMIRRAWAQLRPNESATSRALGISRRALARLLDSLGLKTTTRKR